MVLQGLVIEPFPILILVLGVIIGAGASALYRDCRQKGKRRRK